MDINSKIYSIRLKYRGTKREQVKKYIKLIRPNHPANCWTLDLVKIPNLNLTELTQIHFYFKNNSKLDVEIKIEDRLLSVSRDFKYNKFGNSGPKINLPKLDSVYRYFAVKFHQNMFVENDPGKRCNNYNTNSYDDCDADFIKTILEKNYPAGFLPVWASEDSLDVTKYIFSSNKSFEAAYADIISGDAGSNCPIPCTSTDVKTVFLDEKIKSDNPYSKIDIAFSDMVTITSSDFPKFNPAGFLSSLGGSMGLWLGLGVVQTIELLVGALCASSSFSRMFKK